MGYRTRLPNTSHELSVGFDDEKCCRTICR